MEKVIVHGGDEDHISHIYFLLRFLTLSLYHHLLLLRLRHFRHEIQKFLLFFFGEFVWAFCLLKIKFILGFPQKRPTIVKKGGQISNISDPLVSYILSILFVNNEFVVENDSDIIDKTKEKKKPTKFEIRNLIFNVSH